MEQSSFTKAYSRSPSQTPRFCLIRRFSIVFARTRHRFLSWARQIQISLPHCFLKINFNIIPYCMPTSSELFFPFRIPNKNFIGFSGVFHMLHSLPTWSWHYRLNLKSHFVSTSLWLICANELLAKKVTHYVPILAHWRRGGIAPLFLNLGSRRGWVDSITPRPHFPTGISPVPIGHEPGWSPEPAGGTE
jgi:hypothetical protein